MAWRQATAVALLLALFLIAVSSTFAARLEPADFTYVNGGEVSSLDPAVVTGQPEGRIIRSIFEGLVVKHPQTLEPMPGAAESWSVSGDGLIWTFQLRPGSYWNNLAGDLEERWPERDWEITAEHFVWSFERFLHPLTAAEYGYQLWYVKGAEAFSTDVDHEGNPKQDFAATVGIRAKGRYTLEFELNSPTPFFLDLVGFYPLFPVCKHNIELAQERWPDSWQIEWLKKENLVCNGPYLIGERFVNDRIRLVKNPRYWDADRVAFDTVDALSIEQYGTMLNMYLTGAVDWIDRLATNVVPRMLPREDFDPRPYLSCYFYRVNVTRPPLDDARVRRALALTIDRKSICDKIMKAGQLPAWALVPPGLTGYTNGEMQRAERRDGSQDAWDAAFQLDCEEARRLLAEAGYGPDNPLPTIEIHYNTSEAHRDIAEVIAVGWKRSLGIDVKHLNQEWKVYLDTQSNLGYDVSRSGWIADYADPNTYIDLFVTGGENNKTGWGNERYDELVRLAAREQDPARRLGLLQAAESVLTSELPILPIYSYVTQNVINPRLGGWHNTVTDEHFPKFWYWLSDEELAAKRAAYPDGTELISAPGPAAGKRPPAGLAYERVDAP